MTTPETSPAKLEHRFTMQITKEMAEAIDRHSSARHMTASAWLRSILGDVLQREGDELRHPLASRMTSHHRSAVENSEAA